MNYLSEIMRQYEQQREKNLEELEKRKLEVQKRIPRIREVDVELAQIGLEIAKAVFKDPSLVDSAVQQIQKISQKLKREKAILLTDNNFPLNYLDLQFRCKSCKDTGFQENNKRCKCFEKQLVEKAYNFSSLGQKLKRENFRTFNVGLFSSESIDQTTPQKRITEILASAHSFISRINKKPAENMLFTGHTGVGKTFLCSCIAKELMDKHYSVIYQTAFQIIDIISQYKFSDKQDYQLKSSYDLIFTVDLLIIDDLGTEMINSFTQAEAFNIVNTRLLNDKSTIISTNLTPIEISKNYGERLGSRILGHYEIHQFLGSDLRLQ